MEEARGNRGVVPNRKRHLPETLQNFKPNSLGTIAFNKIENIQD
jgi:hypothetical protein